MLHSFGAVVLNEPVKTDSEASEHTWIVTSGIA